MPEPIKPSPQPLLPRVNITIFDMINIRVTLASIANPSTEIAQTIAILDTHILAFANDLRTGAQQ